MSNDKEQAIPEENQTVPEAGQNSGTAVKPEDAANQANQPGSDSNSNVSNTDSGLLGKLAVQLNKDVKRTVSKFYAEITNSIDSLLYSAWRCNAESWRSDGVQVGKRFISWDEMVTGRAFKEVYVPDSLTMSSATTDVDFIDRQKYETEAEAFAASHPNVRLLTPGEAEMALTLLASAYKRSFSPSTELVTLNSVRTDVVFAAVGNNMMYGGSYRHTKTRFPIYVSAQFYKSGTVTDDVDWLVEETSKEIIRELRNVTRRKDDEI